MEVKQGNMAALANTLARLLGRPVIDMTGLTGRYDFDLEYSGDDSNGMMTMPATIRRHSPACPGTRCLYLLLYPAARSQVGRAEAPHGRDRRGPCGKDPHRELILLISLEGLLMLRREFLKSVPPVVMMPQLRSAPRLKITDIRVVNLKTVRETGKMEAAWNPGTVTTHRIGGGSIIEIHTDQGLSGIGPAIDNVSLEPAKAQLIGKDPFSVEQLAGPLRYYIGQTPRTVSESGNCVVGPHRQGCRPAALQTLGRGQGQGAGVCQHDPAFHTRGKGPHGCPTQVARLEGDQTSGALSDIEGRCAPGRTVRKAVGDDMEIMVDANQAQSFGAWQPGVMWDFRRALQTARELEV